METGKYKYPDTSFLDDWRKIMSEDLDKDMLSDYHKAIKTLKAQNEILLAAMEHIYSRVRGDQTLKNQIQKLATLEDIQKSSSKALFDHKQVR